jgi:hypothetical protein
MVSGADLFGCQGDTATLTVQVLPIGIDDPEQQVVEVYPNPASTMVWVAGLSDECPQAKVTIINATGQNILEQQCLVADGFIRIVLGNIPDGTYFARIKACNTNLTLRLVVLSR